MTLVGGGIAALLSIMVLSRVVADNPLYRVAQYLLIGVALGYVAAVLVGQTLVPPIAQVATLEAPLETIVLLSVAAVLSLLLLTRFGSQRASALANVPLAIIFGVGAAIALIGATRGTIVPQLLDTVAAERLQPPDLASGAGTIALIVATVATLWSFRYAQGGAGPSRFTAAARGLGRGLILATFGVFLAAAVTTYVAALVAQIEAIGDWIAAIASLF
jgi:hypothetical protein